LGCAGSFGNLADDPTACTTSNFALNLPDAEGGGSCEFLYFSNDPLWNRRASEVFSSRLGGSHAGGHPFADELPFETPL
jgi:hypothetical protein